MEEKKENKIAALLRKPDAMEQTAVQVVPQYNLSSNKITEGKSGVATEELATRVSGVEALIPKIDVKIGKVSKKVDNLKGSTNKKFERITKEIDIIAEGIDDNNKRVTKLSALIEKNKKDSDKDSKKSEKADNKIITILTNMLDFMKLTFEEDNLARDQKNNFSEEQNVEKDRKDKELLEALKGGKPTAERIKDEKTPGWLSTLLTTLMGIFTPLKKLIGLASSLFKFFTGAFGKVMKILSFFSKGLLSFIKFIPRLLMFLVSPLGLMLLAAAAAGYGLFKLYEWAMDNDQSKMTPSEAAAALEDPSIVRAEAQRKFKKQNVSVEEIEETRKELAAHVTGGRKRAEDVLNMPEGPQKIEAIKKLGGIKKIEQILADKTEYKVPVTTQERIPPRPETGKGVYINLKPGEMTNKLKLAQRGWDEKYGADYNPDGTKKMEYNAAKDSQAANVTPPAPAPSTTGSSEEGMKDYKGRSSSPESAPVTPKEVPSPVSSATPMTDTPNLGTQMATMSNENALAKTVEELAVVTSSQVNNVMSATKSIVEHTTDKMPSVRNQEDTFQRMIFNSTRVV